MTFVNKLNEKKAAVIDFSPFLKDKRLKFQVLAFVHWNWNIGISIFLSRGEFFVAGVNGEERPRVEKREWDVKAFNYDNCGIAMITLFAVQTSEGWVE